MSIWTIYEHPPDFPDFFVVRMWKVLQDGKIKPDFLEQRLRATLEEARKVVPPRAIRIPAEKGSDPLILETWL